MRSFGRDDGDLGLGIAERDHPLERVADEPRVGVEDQRPALLRQLLEPARPAGGEAAVRLLDHGDGREPLPHERDRVVARVVVDDDGRDALDAREALLDPRQGVVGRDDDADVSPLQRQPCSTSGRGAASHRFPEEDAAARRGEHDRDEEEEEAGREGRRRSSTPTLPRKLTKNASRTANPFSVNGTSSTRKNSGPIT